MKLTLTGSLGNIGKPLTQQLVKAGHDVTVVTSSADRVGDIEALGAKATVGSVSDAAFLTKAFAGAEAVFAMTPPAMGGSNIIANTFNAGKAFATAFKNAGVQRVVMLSSIGAHLSSGTGPIAGIHQIEELYSTLDGISFSFLRAGFFFTNFYNDVAMIQHAGILGANYPANVKIPYAHPRDIAAAVAEALLQRTSGKHVEYIISDVRTPAEAAKVLGAAIGKADLPWVEFSDKQALQGAVQAGLPQELAGLYIEMGSGLKNGKIQEDFVAEGAPVKGKVKLEEFAREFAEKV